MPGVGGAPRRAALMRRLRRSQVVVPRLAAAAALVLITAAASTAVVAAAPAHPVAAHEAGGPIGPELPPGAPVPEVPPVPGDPAAVPPPEGALPTVDGTAPIDGAPADPGLPADTGLGDTSGYASGDTGTVSGDVPVADGGGSTPVTGGSSGGAVGGSTGTGAAPVTTTPAPPTTTTPATPALTRADVCRRDLTPANVQRLFGVPNTRLERPTVVGNRTTCLVTDASATVVLTVAVSDPSTPQQRADALAPSSAGGLHRVYFGSGGQRMVEVDVPRGTAATVPAADEIAKGQLAA